MRNGRPDVLGCRFKGLGAFRGFEDCRVGSLGFRGFLELFLMFLGLTVVWLQASQGLGLLGLLDLF